MGADICMDRGVPRAWLNGKGKLAELWPCLENVSNHYMAYVMRMDKYTDKDGQEVRVSILLAPGELFMKGSLININWPLLHSFSRPPPRVCHVQTVTVGPPPPLCRP